MNFQSVILSALVAIAPFASKWWVCANDDCLFCFETQSDWNANWLVNELTTITKKSRDTLAYRYWSSRQTCITHLCMSECNPGSCVQDIQLCRRRAGGDLTAAGGLPPVWGSGGSLRPGVPHRNDRRDDNLKAGEVKGQKGRLTVVENYKELFTWRVELKKIYVGKGDMSPHCGRCCPGCRVPPHRPPHTGLGGEGAHLDTRYTGIPKDPNRKHRSCGRLGRSRKGKNCIRIAWYFFSRRRQMPLLELLWCVMCNQMKPIR